MAILAKVEKKTEKKAVEKKTEEKVQPVAMKAKQVMKRKSVSGKFVKALQQKGKEVDPVKAMKSTNERPTKTVVAARTKALAMKSSAKAVVKEKLIAMKGKAAAKKTKESKSESESESEAESDSESEKTKKSAAAAPKAKSKAQPKSGKLVIGKFAKGVQQKGKTAKDEKESGKPKLAMKSKLAEETVEVAKSGKKVLKPTAAATQTKAGKAKAPVLAEKDIVAKRKEELNKMLVADLKELAVSKGLEKGTKEVMVKELLAFEAKAREEANAREQKVKQVEKKIKDDLKTKSLPDLKEMCRSKSLPLGGAKDDLIARCFAAAKKEGEVDQILNNMAKESRRAELLGLDKEKLLSICKKSGIDPFVKEVMVERIVAQQAVAGC